MTPDAVYVRLGALLGIARRRRGLTQLQVADACGLTRASIANIEAGQQAIQVHTLIAACQTVGISPARLIREATKEPRP